MPLMIILKYQTSHRKIHIWTSDIDPRHDLIINHVILLFEFHKHKANDRKIAFFEIIKVDINLTRSIESVTAAKANTKRLTKN